MTDNDVGKSRGDTNKYNTVEIPSICAQSMTSTKRPMHSAMTDNDVGKSRGDTNKYNAVKIIYKGFC